MLKISINKPAISLALSLTFERLKNENFSLSVNTVSIGVGNIPPEKNQIVAISKDVILWG